MDSLIKHLPKYYKKSAVIAAVLLPHENELKRIISAVEEAERQMLISKATTALSLYEADLGITPNISEDYETRRNRILAKLRGLGTTTLSALKSVIENYADCVIRIEENFSEYTIIVFFVDNMGQPNNLDEIVNHVESIIPAHIKVRYKETNEKSVNIYAGIALHNAVSTVVSVDGINLSDYTWLVDEDENILVDEDGYILLA